MGITTKEGPMSLKNLLAAALVAVAVDAAMVSQSIAQESAPKDRSCVLDCREVFGRCSNAAYTSARMCIQSCGDLVAHAREVCAAAPESDDCHAARRRAAACVRECRESLSKDLRVCRADAKDCVALCPDAEPMVPLDPICLHECRRQVRACLERAEAAAHDCAEPCSDLVAKARRICTAAPRSEDCAAARREASACLQPCRERLASQTRQCVANGKRCAASCPPAVSSTAPNR
jgi:hypothetical protein